MGQATIGPRYHVPVMATEVVDLFRTITDGVIVDATYGGGGHSERLLSELAGKVRVIGLDRDPTSVAAAEPFESDRLRVLQANFEDLTHVISTEAVATLSGVLFDLGVSSDQLDDPSRGFSYRYPGPLDMRMGPDAKNRADEVVNEWSADELASTIRKYGEERFAHRIAAAIVRHRPITDTGQLAAIVRSAIPAATRRTGGHPARRTFQALRVAVNDELEAFRRGLDQAIGLLAPRGRCIVIAYHSLEDRIAKSRFVAGARGCVCPPELPVCACGQAAELIRLTRKPARPTAEEVARNPRSRSARLRAVEKAA